MKSFFLFFIFIINVLLLSADEFPKSQNYVSVKLQGQLGNQLFQIATAYAYALDNHIPLLIPDLVNNNSYNISYNNEKLFLHKIDNQNLPHPPAKYWSEPSFNYSPIPTFSQIELTGYFQSEKYFKHRRKEIIELFSPPKSIHKTILTKYPFLSSNALIVGIQIRDYRKEMPSGAYHPTKTRSYYEKAMMHFPENTIFLVSSNNLDLARECTQGFRSNIIYLDGEDYIEEFYTLTLCKSFIIGNSSFGWWASWLSTADNKTVIAPRTWFASPYNNEQMTRDIFPEGCILINE